MKPLSLHLKRKGVFYSQEQRTETTALYSLRYDQRGPIIGFDCFQVRLLGGKLFKGKTIPPYEQFPRDSDFGSSAWSFSTKEAAMEKFNELVNASQVFDSLQTS
jgi:hypothetical protein